MNVGELELALSHLNGNAEVVALGSTDDEPFTVNTVNLLNDMGDHPVVYLEP